MNIDAIKKAIALMEHHHLTTFRYRDGNLEIELTRSMTENERTLELGSSKKKLASIGDVSQKVTSNSVIKAPLVGIYYDKPNPTATPYIHIGKKIHKGECIGVIESMKVMNEIKSAYEGIVVSLPFESGSLVQFDDVLVELTNDDH